VFYMNISETTLWIDKFSQLFKLIFFLFRTFCTTISTVLSTGSWGY
jgi:hypothetical protein